MNIILLDKFNNYFNRIVKRLTTVNQYISGRNYHVINNVNFAIGDGVNAEQVVNFDEKWIPDYALVVDSNNTILSKWFVVETYKIRGKQYRLTLKRDVISDYWESIKNAPIFIEKGILPASNPMLFNTEGNIYNQIKVKETLLKDETDISWIVGYYAQNDKQETPKEVSGEVSYIEGTRPEFNIADLPEALKQSYGRVFSTDFAYNMDFGFLDTEETFDAHKNKGYISIGLFKDSNLRFSKKFEEYPSKGLLLELFPNTYLGTFNETLEKAKIRIFGILKQEMFKNRIVTPEEIKKYDNAIITKEDGSKFILEISKDIIAATKNPEVKKFDASSTLATYLGNLFYQNGLNGLLLDPSKRKDPYVTVSNDDYYIVNRKPYEDSLSLKIKTTIPIRRNKVNDAPYDMFCIPYDKDDLQRQIVNTGTSTIEVNNPLSLAMARTLATQLGGTGTTGTLLYDIQILPYCPIPELKKVITKVDGKVTYNITSLNGFTDGKDYNIIEEEISPEESRPVSIMFWATQTTGTFDIPFNYEVPREALNLKVLSETTFLRLCSSNYNGVFEFNPAKNNGVKYINVDYTYRPYSPYIHMNPNFGGIYGNDYNDSRGLIVGGDFSMATLTDNFVRYELNNKNYQAMFDREIKYMDKQHDLQMEQRWISTGLDTATSSIAGAAGGALLGGPVGAAVGAVAGGVSALGGGIADAHYTETAYREEKAFKKDMYTFQLGSIKAQPQSLAKTNPFTANNKIFPFIEEYTCTDEEKFALINKIKYNGMTVSVIETIRNFILEFGKDTYFKGQVIRLKDLDDDYHIASAIYSEIEKGVYL